MLIDSTHPSTPSSRWRTKLWAGALAFGICASNAIAFAAPASTGITWTQVGKPSGAVKIAGCADGSLYAMNSDHSLWRNTSGGTDAGWKKVGSIPGAQDITCAIDLFAFNTDRTLWKNTGTPTAPSWTKIGKPAGAKQISAGWGTGKSSPALFALNDDNSFWMSETGGDGSWFKNSNARPDALLIAAGRTGIWEFKKNKELWRGFENSTGKKQSTAPGAALIVDDGSALSGAVWALNTDKTLWRGKLKQAPNDIEYHGGMVFSQVPLVHTIFYGTWSATDKAVITDLISNLGGTSYWRINTTYDDTAGGRVQNAMKLGKSISDAGSKGKNLKEADMVSIIQNAVGSSLPRNSGPDVYMLLTGSDVTYDNLCSTECGHHFSTVVVDVNGNPVSVPYAIVANNACCRYVFSTPNGGTVDAAASTAAHELAELLSDPRVLSTDGWFNESFAGGGSYGPNGESADICGGDLGATQRDGAGNTWNLAFGTHKYLLQTMYKNSTPGGCQLAF